MRCRGIAWHVRNSHPHQITFPSEAGKKIDDTMNIVRTDFEPDVDFHRGQARVALTLTERNDFCPKLGAEVVNVEAAPASEQLECVPDRCFTAVVGTDKNRNVGSKVDYDVP